MTYKDPKTLYIKPKWNFYLYNNKPERICSKMMPMQNNVENLSPYLPYQNHRPFQMKDTHVDIIAL